MNKQLQAAAQLRRAVQKFAATLSEEEAMEIACVYPVWKPDTAYKAGEILSYGENTVGDPQLYKIAQAHTSQADWTPDITLSLYTPIGLTSAGYPMWAQPVGAHDSYAVDDIVDYYGTLYRSTVDGNVWEPGVFGWEIYTE